MSLIQIFCDILANRFFMFLQQVRIIGALFCSNLISAMHELPQLGIKLRIFWIMNQTGSNFLSIPSFKLFRIRQILVLNINHRRIRRSQLFKPFPCSIIYRMHHGDTVVIRSRDRPISSSSQVVPDVFRWMPAPCFRIISWIGL